MRCAELPAAARTEVPVMSAKRWCLLSLRLLIALCLLTVALVALVDPFEIYHRALFYTPAYDSRTQMYNNAGIARHHEYDSVILGSSVTENCMPSDYDAALGGRFVKLCMNGGMALDHAKMMDMAFATHDVRRVVYGLDLFAYWQYYTIQRSATPDYLYDGNPLNDAPYWFNKSVLLTYVPDALTRVGPYREQMRDWMYFWEPPQTDESALLARVDLTSPPPEQTDGEASCALAQGNLDHNLLPYIRAHRETVFTVFFPPYSLLYWADQARGGTFEACLAQKALIARALLAEPNVELFDFQTAFEWTGDFSLYSDLIHYHAFVNADMALRMASGDCRVRTQEEMEQNARALREAVYALFPQERSDP